MRLLPGLLALAMSLMSCTALAVAAPIRYDEAVDGPLPEHPGPDNKTVPVSLGPSDFQTIGLGLNRWTGTLYDMRDGYGAIFDTMPFIVPTGVVITGARMTTGNFTTAEGRWSGYRFSLYRYADDFSLPPQQGLHTWFRQPHLERHRTPVFTAAMPLMVGNYSLSFSGQAHNFVRFPVSFDYTVEVDARPLPVGAPSTLGLTLAGVLSLGLGLRTRAFSVASPAGRRRPV